MFDALIYEFKKSYNVLFNKENLILSISSLSVLIWCWVLRFILLYNTNEEAFKWGTNPAGHIMAVFSGLFALTILLKIMGKITINFHEFTFKIPILGKITIVCNELILDSLGIMIFDAWCLYIMAGIFIADICAINFMYLVVDIFKLSYFTYMTKLCFQNKPIQVVI